MEYQLIFKAYFIFERIIKKFLIFYILQYVFETNIVLKQYLKKNG